MRHYRFLLVISTLFLTFSLHARSLTIVPVPPAIQADTEAACRLEISARSSEQIMGDLPVTLKLEGPGFLTPQQMVLRFKVISATNTYFDGVTAVSDAYYLPTLSTGQVQVTATAPGFIPASAWVKVEPAFKDFDYDGVSDAVDNCPNQYNPDQFDADIDGIGDVCDSLTDSDDDGVDDKKDNCPVLYNPDQKDRDHDGYGDACDNFPDDSKKD